MSTVLKVSGRSNPAHVAGAIAGQLRDHGQSMVQAVGPRAINQAIKATVLAREYLEKEGMTLSFSPEFVVVEIGGHRLKGVRLVVTIGQNSRHTGSSLSQIEQRSLEWVGDEP